jgi:hypothetical protein
MRRLQHSQPIASNHVAPWCTVATGRLIIWMSHGQLAEEQLLVSQSDCGKHICLLKIAWLDTHLEKVRLIALEGRLIATQPARHEGVRTARDYRKRVWAGGGLDGSCTGGCTGSCTGGCLTRVVREDRA